MTLEAIGLQGRMVVAAGGIYTSEPDGKLLPVLRPLDQVDPYDPDSKVQSVELDTSDASVDHAALRARTSWPDSRTVLLLATLPEPGAITSGAACAFALAARARIRRRS